MKVKTLSLPISYVYIYILYPYGGYAAYVYIYILHILYSKGIQPSVYQKGIQTLITAAPYKRVGFPKLTPCGTNPLISGKIDRWIKGAMKIARRSRGRKVHGSLIKHVR